jgi:hypothetical protein
MSPGAWSTWHSIKVSQDLGTKSSNGFGDRLGQTTCKVVAFVATWPKPYSADDATRSSQALGMSASHHPRNMVWTMFRQRSLGRDGAKRQRGVG